MVNEEHPTPNWHFAQYNQFHAFKANKFRCFGDKGDVEDITEGNIFSFS
jgi:hypothetical protein